MPQPTPQKCLNCDAPFVQEAAYCTECGQSVKDSRLSAVEVVKDALSNIFNLDNRIFHTGKDIYLPSKLTKTYVAGRRKYYLSPARLFLVSLLLFITALLADADLQGTNDAGEDLREDVLMAEHKVVFDSLALTLGSEVDQEVLTSISDSLYGDINADSMWIGQGLNLQLFGLDFADLRITKNDALNLSGEELVDKYEIYPFFHRLAVKQYIKGIKDTDSGIRYALKNLTWVLFFLVFLIAVVLKLLYIRGGYYYVEHLVLLLYWHSPFFLAGAVIFLADTYIDSETILEDGMNYLLIWSLVSAFITMKNYYQQGWIKTFIKLLALIVIYFLLALFLLIIGAIISLMIF